MIQWRTVGYSASQCPVQWGTVEVGRTEQQGTMQFSRNVQWKSVECTERYSGCQTMNINFWENQWILNSEVVVNTICSKFTIVHCLYSIKCN